MKNLNTKLEIKEELHLHVDVESTLCGSLKDVANNILALEERLKKEHQLVIQNPNLYIRFEIRTELASYHRDDDYIQIQLYGIRLETDIEFEKRIAKHESAVKAGKLSAKKRAENNKKKELEIFLKLKKKFENNKTVK